MPRIIGQPNYRTIVKGRVVLKGTPPPEKETPVPDDYPCQPPEPPVLKTHNFIVGTNAGLANTVVQPVRLGSEASRVIQFTEVTNELVLTECRLEPAFTVVVGGQQLKIRDTLGVSHVLLSAMGEIEVPPQETVSLPTRLNSDSPVTIACKTHPWEQSQVWFQSVLPFTITDANGNFSITNVAPGDYLLVATHWSGNSSQKTSQKISVRPGRTNSIDLIIQAPATETAAQF